MFSIILVYICFKRVNEKKIISIDKILASNSQPPRPSRDTTTNPDLVDLCCAMVDQ